MSTLSVHKQKWINCTRCELCKTRKFVVLGKGQVPCDVLVIGEAPGQSEDVIGRPFEGPAGDLLILEYQGEPGVIPQALQQAGIEPTSLKFAFTNLIACIPLEKESLSKTATPSPESIKECRPRLIEFANLCKPRLIVLAGALALKHVPPEVLKNRQWVQIDHPAYLLRVEISQRGLAIQRAVVTLRDALGEL